VRGGPFLVKFQGHRRTARINHYLRCIAQCDETVR
jgi:hypothetical protein